ncbi:hypothetical protein GCM10009759_57060 [Kitasatospora saccharophila]|uniref:Uncharacterized protein n=1 Tax=Kitasatospora saccharophila TaxID=407973 RepID=A0ABN2XK96_9ACTN
MTAPFEEVWTPGRTERAHASARPRPDGGGDVGTGRRVGGPEWQPSWTGLVVPGNGTADRLYEYPSFA